MTWKLEIPKITFTMGQVKIASVVAAVLLAVVSLGVSRKLIRDLQSDELAKMEVWTEAMRSLVVADESTDMNLVLKVINGNNNIPLIVTDSDGNVTTHRNLSLPTVAVSGTDEDIRASIDDSLAVLQRALADFKFSGEHISVPIAMMGQTEEMAADTLHVYYQDSLMLKRLAYFPYVQLGVVALFVIVAVFALMSSKRAEQNKVWVGLSKETAHQLGTPISSLMAWSEVLSELYPDEEMIGEMKKDVQRLELIAERFSKIGSIPELKPAELFPVVEHVVGYIRRRTSEHVTITCHYQTSSPRVSIAMCAPLVEWVLEVLCKNAIDAMAGEGRIDICVSEVGKDCIIEVTDTGKGISRKHFKKVFSPGFTTKQRGWGLGLSLAKRIVEEYHHGRIFVKSSELGVGTTFRMELPMM